MRSASVAGSGRHAPGVALRQPCHDLLGMPVGRKHGIEDLGDDAIAHDQREALDECHARDLERRQAKAAGQGQRDVAQELEGQVQPLRGFALILRGLCAESEYACAQRPSSAA